MIILNWQYRGWKDLPYGSPDLQVDWNQTLLTKFNEARSLHEGLEEEPIIEYVVPSKYQPLIETLVYYNKDKKKINDVNVVFDENSDLISVGKVKIHPVGYEGN